ncbi:MAG TPA: twin-arginine translocase TatA/TatE family subunit [Chthoniobacteraceae bacterium]|jgi:sec-independent protein translocase protein TatA|nr:twin-arginine translocase TatA/TatE family subunit [Chthoniobacteraceae bacterium]
MTILLATLFNLAGPDLIVILLIVLLLFGSKKLPELARGMGQAVKEFNKAKDEIERELTKNHDVTVQPAPGQQPRQPAILPPPQQPVAPSAVPSVTQPELQQQQAPFGAGDAFAGQTPQQPQETHPAGQA